MTEMERQVKDALEAVAIAHTAQHGPTQVLDVLATRVAAALDVARAGGDAIQVLRGPSGGNLDVGMKLKVAGVGHVTPA